jgi:hypothetical protein
MLSSLGIFAETKKRRREPGDNNKRKFELTPMASERCMPVLMSIP